MGCGKTQSTRRIVIGIQNRADRNGLRDSCIALMQTESVCCQNCEGEIKLSLIIGIEYSDRRVIINVHTTDRHPHCLIIVGNVETSASPHCVSNVDDGVFGNFF